MPPSGERMKMQGFCHDVGSLHHPPRKGLQKIMQQVHQVVLKYGVEPGPPPTPCKLVFRDKPLPEVPTLKL